jgi:hypothetical protein
MYEQEQSEVIDRERRQWSDSTSANNALDNSKPDTQSVKQLPGVTDRDSSNSGISSAVQM